MFDIGFFELVMVAVVALLVLGPERLPHAVRMTGAFVGTWLLGKLGISLSAGIVGAILNAMIGAIVILVLIGLVRRR